MNPLSEVPRDAEGDGGGYRGVWASGPAQGSVRRQKAWAGVGGVTCPELWPGPQPPATGRAPWWPPPERPARAWHAPPSQGSERHSIDPAREGRGQDGGGGEARPHHQVGLMGAGVGGHLGATVAWLLAWASLPEPQHPHSPDCPALETTVPGGGTGGLPPCPAHFPGGHTPEREEAKEADGLGFGQECAPPAPGTAVCLRVRSVRRPPWLRGAYPVPAHPVP